MTVTDRSIIVIDHFVGKQIFYDRLTLQPVLDDYDLFKRLRCTELFAIGDIIYYMNDWSNSAIGKYRLFRTLGMGMAIPNICLLKRSRCTGNKRPPIRNSRKRSPDDLFGRRSYL